MKAFLVSVLCCFLTCQQILAQSPGGISAGNTVWLRSDIGLASTSGVVTLWDEISGANITGNFNVQALTGTTNVQTGPSVIDAGINFNPYLRFNGTTNSLSSINAFPGTSLVSNSNITAFQVFNLKGGIVWLKWETDQLGTTARLGFENSAGRIRFDFPKAVPATAGQNVGVTNVLNLHSLSTCFADATSSVNRLNGANNNTITIPGPGNFAGTTDKLVIGNERLLNLPAQIDIAEIIIYSRTLSAAERNKIESYLAVKYGFTLDQAAANANDYTASTGTVIWNRAANSAYASNITGIGKDDGSGLAQKQSRSINTTALLTVYNGTYAGGSFPLTNATNTNEFTTDQTFLLFGDNAAPTTVDQCIFNGKGKRMQRVWKVSQAGPVFPATIAVDQASVPATVKNIIVSPDPAFPPGNTTFYPLSAANGKWYAPITFNHNDYFTFATDTLVITMAATDPTCTNPNGGTVVTTVTGNSQAPVYAWTPSGQATANLSNVAAGTYTLTITQGGCQAAQQVTLNAPVLPAAPLVNGYNVCQGSSATLTVNNPLAGATYNWYDVPSGGTVLGTGTTFTTPAVTADVSYYVETVVGSCSSVRTLVFLGLINVIPPVLRDTTICTGKTVSLSVLNPVAGYTYNWYAAASGGVALGTGVTFTTPALSANATYYVEPVVSSCPGSRIPVQVSIDIVSPPVSNSVSVCSGNTATLTVQNPVSSNTYNWYASGSGGTLLLSGANVTTPVIVAGPITYYVEAYDGLCSSTRTPVVINLIAPLDSPKVSASDITTSSVTFTWLPVTGAAGYEVSVNGGTYFSPGNGPGILTYTVSGLAAGETVTLSVVALSPPQGCGKSTAGHATATTYGEGFYVPTAFTPNGDNLNDILTPVLPGGSVLNYFTVYNRWGQKVFSTSVSGTGWDGKFKGSLQPIGTFVWLCRFVYRGNIVDEKGTFTLFY